MRARNEERETRFGSAAKFRFMPGCGFWLRIVVLVIIRVVLAGERTNAENAPLMPAHPLPLDYPVTPISHPGVVFEKPAKDVVELLD